MFYFLYKFKCCLHSPFPRLIPSPLHSPFPLHGNRYLNNTAWSRMCNFLKPGGWWEKPWEKWWPRGTSKNMEGQFCDSQMYFPAIWSIIGKFLPILVEMQIWEKIQQISRREIEPKGFLGIWEDLSLRLNLKN